MSAPRVIKKYSNRRLYDTAEKKYVNLTEVRQLVVDGVEFTVTDVKSGDDITRQILLQVIAELELGGHPMLTSEILTQMIRFYGGAFQNVFTDYLSQTVSIINGQQQAYQNQLNELLGASGMSSVSDIAQQNLKIWTDMQQQVLKMYGIQPTNKPSDSETSN